MFEVAGEANHMQVLMFEVFMDSINEHSELGNLKTIKFLNSCESRDIIINRMWGLDYNLNDDEIYDFTREGFVLDDSGLDWDIVFWGYEIMISPHVFEKI